MLSKKIAAVVVAAGASRRMGVDKLFLQIRGKPVLWHSLRVMASVPGCTELVVVTRQESRVVVDSILGSINFSGKVSVVEGGAKRQDSVRIGLNAVGDGVEFVMIHDGARPFTRLETITSTLEAAVKYGAAVCGREVTDTIKRVSLSGEVIETPPRGELRAVQTPQIFKKNLICEAYEKLSKSGIVMTDDTAVAAWAGYPVYVVTNQFPNPKITLPGDIEIYERLLG